MKKVVSIFAALAICLSSTLALAHSGGTDSKGCHRDSRTGIKHCH